MSVDFSHPENTQFSPGDTRVVIVGAGLAGSLMACYLAEAGYQVRIFERRPDPRSAGFVGGRSINLALSVRGITALSDVGLAEAVLRDAVPMQGRMMHDRNGKLTFQHYSRKRDEAIHSVSRGELNMTLINAADTYNNVQFFFDHQCEELLHESRGVRFASDALDESMTVTYDLLIGADGAFSAVRGALQKIGRFNFTQSYLEHGYKELTIPAVDEGEHGKFALRPNALHIWPRGESMMIALPNQDGSFTCTLFWPYQGPSGFAAIRSADDVLPFFEQHYADALPHMPTLVEDYTNNPIGSLLTIRCEPWHLDDSVVLIGDAAHAIVPFFGQGMNAAFEDCRLLDACLKERPTLADALSTFTQTRKDDADAIADMALDNFIEMRDKTASPAFLRKKKIAHFLHKWFPKKCMPLYNMVSFSNIPYAHALAFSRQRMQRAKAIGCWALIMIIAAALVGIGYFVATFLTQT